MWPAGLARAPLELPIAVLSPAVVRRNLGDADRDGVIRGRFPWPATVCAGRDAQVRQGRWPLGPGAP